MLHQGRQTLERQNTQAPWDQGCERAAPCNGDAGEAGQAPRTKPSKLSGTGEEDLGVAAEERTGRALRKYSGNRNHYESSRSTEAKKTVMVLHLSDGK